MKKAILLFSVAFISLQASQKTITFDTTPRILSINELSYERIQELIQSKDSDFMIALEEGASFPLKFLLKHRLFSSMLDPNLSFTVAKTCYLRVVNKKCYISEDLIHWEKTSRLLSGKSKLQLVPNEDKPGFTLQTTLTEEESEDASSDS